MLCVRTLADMSLELSVTTSVPLSAHTFLLLCWLVVLGYRSYSVSSEMRYLLKPCSRDYPAWTLSSHIPHGRYAHCISSVCRTKGYVM